MEHEVIIVGAGPAGLSTGLHLAQIAPELAAKTLILEKEHHPRPKLCGGGVLPGAEACLRELGLDLASSIPTVPVYEMVMQFQGRRIVKRRKPVVFRTVRREQFDAWLAGAARERGLALREGVRVREVRVRDGRVLVLTDQGEFSARVVVGADGSRGVVRRAVAAGERAQGVARLLEIRVPAVPQSNPAGRALFDFSWIVDGVQGYVWDFPTPSAGDAMRTWGVYDSRIFPDRPLGRLPDALDEGLAKHNYPADGYRLEGHPLRWFHPRATFAAPHVVLVGDAAGTDPVVGEGISFALGYGEVAAGALADAFARDDFSFADYRQRVMGHRIGRYLRRRVMGAQLLYGLRPHGLRRALWPLVVWAGGVFFIDWTWGEKR